MLSQQTDDKTGDACGSIIAQRVVVSDESNSVCDDCGDTINYAAFKLHTKALFFAKVIGAHLNN